MRLLRLAKFARNLAGGWVRYAGMSENVFNAVAALLKYRELSFINEGWNQSFAQTVEFLPTLYFKPSYA